MLHCFSVSHQNTRLAIREKLNLSDAQVSAWLREHAPQRLVVLSTCNRLEMYSSEADAPTLWHHLLRGEEVAPHAMHLTGLEAARHLFQVASSLRSMALGEAQILGQVTRAFELAQAAGTVGHELSLLFRAAIHAAKRVHNETSIDKGHTSVSALGIAKIEAVLGPLRDRPVLVIGAGEMAQAVIKGLARRQISELQLVSRTYANARQLAATWGLSAHPINQLPALLTQAEVVFSATSAATPILSAAELQPIMARRGGRPLYMVDIALPRDIAPEVGALPQVHLYNLDDLQQVVDGNRKSREQAIPYAHAIIEEELRRCWQALESLALVPTIRQIREQADSIRQLELERIMSKLPPDAQAELARLFEEFSHRFMNKILHQPTHNLRAHAGNTNSSLLNSAARTLFGLEES